MWTLLLILALAALWFSPSARRSLARLIDPDDRSGGPPPSSGKSPRLDPERDATE